MGDVSGNNEDDKRELRAVVFGNSHVAQDVVGNGDSILKHRLAKGGCEVQKLKRVR